MYQPPVGYNRRSSSSLRKSQSSGVCSLAEDRKWQAEYQGSGTFIISKPKRKANKKRQTKVRNPQRGAR